MYENKLTHIEVPITKKGRRLLDELTATGLFGTDAGEVAMRMIDAALVAKVSEGWLTLSTGRRRRKTKDR